MRGTNREVYILWTFRPKPKKRVFASHINYSLSVYSMNLYLNIDIYIYQFVILGDFRNSWDTYLKFS